MKFGEEIPSKRINFYAIMYGLGLHDSSVLRIAALIVPKCTGGGGGGSIPVTSITPMMPLTVLFFPLTHLTYSI
jgi:hypothetical protein